MELSEKDRKRIQEIIGGMQCPKGFKCAEDGFENLCRTKQFGSELFLQCLEETSPPCPFAGVYDYGFRMFFCRCPLRVYLAKNIGK
jgi:hypothetical protein